MRDVAYVAHIFSGNYGIIVISRALCADNVERQRTDECKRASKQGSAAVARCEVNALIVWK